MSDLYGFAALILFAVSSLGFLLISQIDSTRDEILKEIKKRFDELNKK